MKRPTPVDSSLPPLDPKNVVLLEELVSSRLPVVPIEDAVVTAEPLV